MTETPSGFGAYVSPRRNGPLPSDPKCDAENGSTVTACPVCGSDGVTACVGLNGADHPGRPAFFDANATAALDSMARRDRGGTDG